MGRRGVQHLSPAQWRDALEQQIREKEKQQQRREDGAGDEASEAQRRSQSAPQQEEGNEQLARSLPGLERAATCGEGDENSHTVRERRRFQQLQSRDEYLKGLQDQIEEKKRLAQEQLEKERSRQRRGSQSEEDDAGDQGDRLGDEQRWANSKTRELHDTLDDRKTVVVSNQHEVQAPVLKTEVAADAEVITKIVDFCEELKKQNEDVKRQLLEQHTVLASLHSTLATDPDVKRPVDRSRQRNSVFHRELETGDVPAASSIKKAQAKGFEVKPAVTMQIAPRPRPVWGESKIPLPRKRLPSSLRSAGINIVKNLTPDSPTQPISPLKRAEAKHNCCEGREINPTDISSMPLESASSEKEILRSSEFKAHRPENGDSCEFQDPQHVPESEAKEEVSPTSSEKETRTKSSGDLNEVNVRVNVQDKSKDVGDERPMDTESRLVQNWETDSDLLNCTSISILDGPSSLIPLDRSLSRLF